MAYAGRWLVVRTDPAQENARDPRDVVAQLIATCRAAGRRMDRSGADDSASSELRRCSIELTLLAEACGATLPVPDRRLVHRRRDPSATVLREYRAAMHAPLPRAIQAVLRDHVARLELGSAPSSVAA